MSTVLDYVTSVVLATLSILLLRDYVGSVDTEIKHVYECEK